MDGLVPARQHLAHIELGEHEDQQDKDDDEEQRGQGIDEAGPYIDSSGGSSAVCAGHYGLSDGGSARFAGALSSSAIAAMVRASSRNSPRISRKISSRARNVSSATRVKAWSMFRM